MNTNHCTLQDLAAAKRLSVSYLQELGVQDLPEGGVGITYYDDTGEAVAVKRRTALQAKDGSYWPLGKSLRAYGEWKLAEGRRESRLLLTEGESDCWVLWRHNFPALGLPGANTARTLTAEHLVGIERLYLLQEPDNGGTAFIQGVTRRLDELKFAGQVFLVQLRKGVKDPADLYLQDPMEFPRNITLALRAARPLSLKVECQAHANPASTSPSAGTGVGLAREQPQGGKGEGRSDKQEAAFRNAAEVEAGLMDLDEAKAALPPIRTLTELRTNPPPPQEHLLEGLIPMKAITLLSSKPKIGKTTWLLYLLRAMYHHQDHFLDLAVRQVPTLIVSEEGEDLWRQRCGDLPDGMPLHFLCQPFLGRPTPEQWTAFCRNLAVVIRHLEVGLVVIDPIANLIPGDENSAQAMIDFLSPQRAFTQAGAAVLLLHHPNKQDANDTFGLRGSGSLAGYVDVVLRMSRLPGDDASPVRKLTGWGRHGLRILPEVLAALHEPSQVYHRLGDESEAGATTLTGAIKAFLATDDAAYTVEELEQRCPWPDGRQPNRTVLQNTLRRGLERYWSREGDGGKTRPYGYRALPPHRSGLGESPTAIPRPRGSGE